MRPAVPLAAAVVFTAFSIQCRPPWRHPAPAGSAARWLARWAPGVVSPHGLNSRAAPQSTRVSPAYMCPLRQGHLRGPQCMQDRPLRGGEFRATDIGSGSAAPGRLMNLRTYGLHAVPTRAATSLTTASERGAGAAGPTLHSCRAGHYDMNTTTTASQAPCRAGTTCSRPALLGPRYAAGTVRGLVRGGVDHWRQQQGAAAGSVVTAR